MLSSNNQPTAILLREQNPMRMEYIKKACLSFVLGILLLLSASTIAAQSTSSPDSVRVMIPDTVALPGAHLSIPVVVQDSVDGGNIISYDISMTYDSSVISVDGIETNGTLSNSFSALANTQQPGIVVIGAVDMGPAMSGKGPLLFLNIHILASGVDNTTLHFTSFNFNQGNPRVITTDGRLTVQNAPPTPFEILQPADSINITITRTNLSSRLQLAWQRSQDVEGDSIQYGFVLKSGTVSIIPFQHIDNSTFSIDYSTIANLVNENSTGLVSNEWTIYATDGSDTTYASNGPRSLIVDMSALSADYEKSLPHDFTLEQNYPNPFNPSTTITFQIPHSVPVNITVFDINGRVVKTLLNTQVNSGIHRITWDGKNTAGESMPSGMYFYRLSTPDYNSTRRMTLLK